MKWRFGCIACRQPVAVVTLIFCAMVACGGCEKLAGIHGSKRATAAADAAADGDSGRQDGAGVERTTADALPEGGGTDGAGGDAGAGDGEGDLPRADDGPVDGLPSGGDAAADGDAGVGGDGAMDRTSDARPCDPDPSVTVPLQGTAFRYGSGPNGGTPNGKGMCGFVNSDLPQGGYYGAVESALYAGAARCGACMRVQTGSVTVEVQVIDVLQPLNGAHGSTISVDPGAQALLSPAGGNPDVLFSFVPCTVSGNIKVSFSGSLNPSVIVMNHRNQLQAVQLSTATTTVSLSRQSYNIWTPPQGFIFGGGTVSLVLTDTFGHAVRAPNLPVGTAWMDTAQQFPACP